MAWHQSNPFANERPSSGGSPNVTNTKPSITAATQHTALAFLLLKCPMIIDWPDGPPASARSPKPSLRKFGPAFPKTASDPDRRPRRHGPDGRGPSNGKPLLEIRCARAGPYSKLSHSNPQPLSNQTQSNQSIPIKADLAAGGQSRLRTCASCAARGHEFVGRVRLRRTLIGWKLTARQRQNNTRDGPHFAVCLALPYKGFRLR